MDRLYSYPRYGTACVGVDYLGPNAVEEGWVFPRVIPETAHELGRGRGAEQVLIADDRRGTYHHSVLDDASGPESCVWFLPCGV